MPIDIIPPEDVLALVEARATREPFAYVVTPNVDHVVRLNRQKFSNAGIYHHAWLSTCDSRILHNIGLMNGDHYPITAGCDLVQAMLDKVIKPHDPITIIGCEPEIVEQLKDRYGLRNVAHHNPAFGFIRKPEEVQDCVDFVVNNPARFIFFAVGSPRQEILARKVQQTGKVNGIGLCIGAALHVAAGARSRGPAWARRYGFEWAFRLLQEPHRLWKRYLIDGPMIFYYVTMHSMGRRTPPSPYLIPESTHIPRRSPTND